MLRGKKYIIFDLDGTLIDSVGMWNEVDRRFINALGGEESEFEIQAVRDMKLREYKSMPDPYLAYCEFIGKKYNSPLSGSELVALRYSISKELTVSSVDYKPFADVFLHKLYAKGYTLIIASTTKCSNIDVYCTQNQNIIKKAPLNQLFKAIYTREDAKEIKPNPEIYHRILGEFNTNADECIIFEDSLVGVEAANNANIDVIAIYDKYSEKDSDEIMRRSIAYFKNYEELLRTVEL